MRHQYDVLDCSFLLPKFRQLRHLFPQVENSAHATQDLITQLRTICDSVLHTYLSRVADTAEKQRRLHVSFTAVDGKWGMFGDLDRFLENLHKFKVFDFSVFQPDLSVLLVTMSGSSDLSDYFRSFISDPERSGVFRYKEGLWHTFVATHYMRYLRTFHYPR